MTEIFVRMIFYYFSFDLSSNDKRCFHLISQTRLAGLVVKCPRFWIRVPAGTYLDWNLFPQLTVLKTHVIVGRPQEFPLLALTSTILCILPFQILLQLLLMRALFTSESILYFRSYMTGGT